MKHRLSWVVFFAILPLTACRTEDAPPTSSQVQQIKTAEASGKLPKIDTSKDIKGPDVNNNGARDDLEAWIAEQPMTDKQKRAATQLAIALQKELLVDLTDRAAIQAILDESMIAKKCLIDAYNKNLDEALNLAKKMDAMSTSTIERLRRSKKFDAALSGMAVILPTKYTCP